MTDRKNQVNTLVTVDGAAFFRMISKAGDGLDGIPAVRVPAARVLYIYGDDEYYKENIVKKLIEKAVPEDTGLREFNLHVFDAASKDPPLFPDLAGAAEGMPLMNRFSFILVKNVNLNRMAFDTVDDLLTLTESFFTQDRSDTFLVFVQAFKEDDRGVEKDVLTPKPRQTQKNSEGENDGESGDDAEDESAEPKTEDSGQIKEKIEKANRFIQTIAANKGLIKCSRMDTAGLCSTITRGLTKRGCSVSPNNARRIAELCGDDLFILQSEIEKLANYAQGGEITAEMIDSLVTRSLSASAFDIQGHILSGNSNAALGVLEDLYAKRTDPNKILGGLVYSFARTYRVTLSRGARNGAETLKDSFGYSENAVKYDAAARMNPPKERLLAILKLLGEADRKLKLSLGDPKEILEAFIAAASLTK